MTVYRAEKGFVRAAMATDAEAIMRLSQGLGYSPLVNAGDDTDAQLVATAARLGRLLGSAAQQVWVFDIGGELQGWLHAFVGQRLASSSFVEIGGLVVDSDYRRRGIATQLLSVVRCWAESQDLALRVRCHSERVAAQLFYQSQGLQPLKQQVVFESD